MLLTKQKKEIKMQERRKVIGVGCGATGH